MNIFCPFIGGNCRQDYVFNCGDRGECVIKDTIEKIPEIESQLDDIRSGASSIDLNIG